MAIGAGSTLTDVYVGDALMAAIRAAIAVPPITPAARLSIHVSFRVFEWS